MSYQVQLTPLHVAALQGHSQIITLLIEAGADIDARDSVSRVTLLHLGKLEPSFGYFHLQKNMGNRNFVNKNGQDNHTRSDNGKKLKKYGVGLR